MHEQIDDNLDGDCQGVGGRKTEMKSDSFLFYMVQEGTTEGVLSTFRAQLESVSDVDDIRDSRRNTLLHSSVLSRNLRTVDILLQKGADALAVNLDCDTPLALAKSAYQRSNSTQTEKDIFLLIRYHLEEFQGIRLAATDPEDNSHPFKSDSEIEIMLNKLNTLNINGEQWEFDDLEIPTEEVESCIHQSIDLEVNDFRSLIKGLGVAYPVEDEVIYLSKSILHHVNTYRDSKGRSLLTKFAENGNLEVLNFLLKCRGLDVNSIDENQHTATEISWSKKDYRCFLALIRNDARFPGDFRPTEIEENNPGANDLKEFVDQRMQLHTNIEAGNMEAVVEATKQRTSSLYLKIDNESALLCSSRRRDVHSLKIYAYFLCINLSLGENEIIPPYTIEECKMINMWKSRFSPSLTNLKSLKNYGDNLQRLKKRKYSLKNEFSNFQGYLNSYENFSVLVTTNVPLCISLIYHNLMNESTIRVGETCLFFELNIFAMNIDIILNAYNTEECDYLIVYSYDKDINLGDVSRFFSVDKILENKNRPILILRSDSQDVKCEWKCKVMSYQWDDLSNSTKRVLLDKMVNFQGQDINLGTLILEIMTETSDDDAIVLNRHFSKENLDVLSKKPDVASYFTADVLSYLMCQEEISIGISTILNHSGYNRDCYTYRNFSREYSFYLVFFIVEMSSLGEFLKFIYKIDEEKQLNNKKFIVYQFKNTNALQDFVTIKTCDERVGEMFRELSMKRDETLKAYYYNIRSGEFLTNMSRENSSRLNIFFKKKNIGEQEIIEFSDILKQRHVVIWGEPGSGKSTTVTKCISILKERNPCIWVERINMENFAEGDEKKIDLGRLEFIKKFVDILEFFMDILGLKSCLERCLFRMALKTTGKVRIVIDGYDKMSNLRRSVITSQEKGVYQLLEFLTKETNSQVWITNMRHTGSSFENMLNTFSYKFEDLAYSRQVQFIEKIWKTKLLSILAKCWNNRRSDDLLMFRKKIAAIHTELQKNIRTANDFIYKAKTKLLMRDLERAFSLSEDIQSSKDKQAEIASLKRKIGDTDFTTQASALIKNFSNLLVHGNDVLAISPSILSMISLLAFKRNLKLDAYENTYCLLENFVKEKIKFYLWHRHEFQQLGCSKKEITESKVCELHQMLALKELKQQLWEPEDFYDEANIISGVGIAVPTEGGYTFTYSTLSEFFVLQRIVENIHRPELIAKDLEEVLVELKYGRARSFLNERYKKSGGKDWFQFSDELIKSMKVSKTFLDSVLKKTVKECSNVWPDIIAKFTKTISRQELITFIIELSKSSFHESDDTSIAVLQIISRSLSDEWLCMFLDADITTMHAQYINNYKIQVVGVFMGPFIWASTCSAPFFTELLHMIKRSLGYKAHQNNPYKDLTEAADSFLGGKEKFEKYKFPYGLEETKKFLEVEDTNGWTLLHFALKNKNYDVFSQFLTFFEDILGKKTLGTYFEKINKRGLTILHFCSMSRYYYYHCDRVLKMLNILPQFLDHEKHINLINRTDHCGFIFLHYLVWCANEEVVEETLLHLKGILGSSGLKNFLLHRNNDELNVLHHASNNKDINVLLQVMKHARDLMDDKEFMDFVELGDKKGNTIFHTRAFFDRRYPDLSAGQCKLRSVEDLEKIKSYVSDSVHRSLLLRENNDGKTFLHLSVGGLFNLLNLTYAIKMLDVESLEKFISQRDSNGNNYLHKVAIHKFYQKSFEISDVLDKLKVLPPPSISTLMKMENAKDESVLDIIQRDSPNLYEFILPSIISETIPQSEQ